MNGSGQESTHRAIERVASEEDALSNALVTALKAWPGDGVPQNPEAGLLTAARRSKMPTSPRVSSARPCSIQQTRASGFRQSDA
jgi:predicted RNA polymerase sigma factor